jgi:Protein of unknown function (DUF229)
MENNEHSLGARGYVPAGSGALSRRAAHQKNEFERKYSLIKKVMRNPVSLSFIAISSTAIFILTYIFSLRDLLEADYEIKKIGIEGNSESECNVPTDNEEDLKWWSKQPESPDPLMAPCQIHRLSYADSTGKLHVDPRCLSPEISIERWGKRRKMTDNETITGKKIQNIHCSVEGETPFAMEHSGFSLGDNPIEIPISTEHIPSIPLNVYIILSDTTSAKHFQRSCPLSIQYLKTRTASKVFEFSKYHVLGYHTIQNAIPLFFGHDCGDLFNSRYHSHFYNATDFDKNITKTHFLPAYYKKFGYVTSFLTQHCLNPDAKDPFSLILTDPFPMECHRLLKKFYGNRTHELIDIQQPKYHSCHWWGRRSGQSSSSQCNLVETTTEYFVNMITNLPSSTISSPHKESPLHYFHFLYLKIGHHSVIPEHLAHLDKPLLQILENIDFNNSMFIFFGDHGLHMGPFLQTGQGQIEYKLPALYITLPKWVLKNYPDIDKYLTENQKKLATHWDLHHTLKHLMTYPDRPQELIPVATYSLFSYIPDRSCQTAGIPSEFCVCNSWIPYNKTDSMLFHDMERNLDIEINNYVGKTYKCSEVSVDKIKSIDMSIALTSEGTRHNVPRYYFRILMYIKPINGIPETKSPALLEMILHRDIPKEHLQNVDIISALLHKKREPVFISNSTVVSLRRISAPTKEEKEEAMLIGIKTDLCII